MRPIDDELVARALRWCADAGRHATGEQVRSALGPLSWDELLIARALLADPPPARPLGPWALADMARGAPPDVAAEREREGRYRDASERSAGGGPGGAPGPVPARVARAPTSRVRRPREAQAPVIRRARERKGASVQVPAAPPLVDELFASEGRAVLEQLVRKQGARRAPIVAALAGRWRRGDGSSPGNDDLERLLDAHGLARAFARRERDELLHAVRAAGGVLARAAARVGLSPDELPAALHRLGAVRDAESIREVHREELRRRATLSERTRLLLADPHGLADLGILQEIEDDLRRRLPEHVRALRASGAVPLGPALARSLAVPARELDTLAARLGIDLGVPRSAPPSPPRERRAPRATTRGSAPARPRGLAAPSRPRTWAPPRPRRPPPARPRPPRGPKRR